MQRCSAVAAIYIKTMASAKQANTREMLERRRAAGSLTWTGPALMLFARSVFAVIAQGITAGILSLNGSAAPWHDAARWFPIYATLIDVGCLTSLWLLTRREGMKLVDLVSFDRKRLGRDVPLGLLLIAPSLVFILGGIAATSLVIYGTPQPQAIFEPLPLPAAFYSVLVFPLLWGFTEQMTYNGYLTPRIQVLSGRTVIAVLLVALPWAFQHAVMPVRFDVDYILYRLISPIPFSIFIVLVYLRTRRILPLAIAHWLMDGADAFRSSLWPLLN